MSTTLDKRIAAALASDTTSAERWRRNCGKFIGQCRASWSMF